MGTSNSPMTSIREQELSGAGGVVDAGQGPGEHLRDQAVGNDVVGEGGELGGIAAEPLHLAQGEEDAAVRGVRLGLQAPAAVIAGGPGPPRQEHHPHCHRSRSPLEELRSRRPHPMKRSA